MKGHDVGATVAFADYTRDVDALRKQLADAQATVEALQRERDEAWIRFACVGSHAEFLSDLDDLLTNHCLAMNALGAEREKVRTVEHELAGIVKRNQGGYIGDRIAIDKCLTIIRTLDATTPAQTDEQRCIEACCERPHDCKWGGTGGCGYEGRKPKGGDGE